MFLAFCFVFPADRRNRNVKLRKINLEIDFVQASVCFGSVAFFYFFPFFVLFILRAFFFTNCRLFELPLTA